MTRRTIRRRSRPGASDVELLAAYFASAETAWDDLPASVRWVMWDWGVRLRDWWHLARTEVARRVPARAYALMVNRYDRDDATPLENWPAAERDELLRVLGIQDWRR